MDFFFFALILIFEGIALKFILITEFFSIPCILRLTHFHPSLGPISAKYKEIMLISLEVPLVCKVSDRRDRVNTS